MKIALVDDDRSHLQKMEALCQRFAGQRQVQFQISVFSSGSVFLEGFRPGAYDAIFLDIFMGDSHGVDIAKKLRAMDNQFILVFLTSSMDFMPEAFSCHAYEYILKPFDEGRVFRVLQDILSIRPEQQKYCEVTIDRKTVFLLLSQIVSVVTDAHYLEFSLSDGQTLRSRMTASEFLHRIRNDPRFLSVNKGVILNGDYIADFEDNCCVLENGTKFSVRVRDRVRIEEAVRKHIFENLRSRQRSFAETR